MPNNFFVVSMIHGDTVNLSKLIDDSEPKVTTSFFISSFYTVCLYRNG